MGFIRSKQVQGDPTPVDPVPTTSTSGFITQNIDEITIQFSQLVKLTSYDIDIYGTMDDLNADGSSTFPAGIWPKMDSLSRTKSEGIFLVVDVRAFQRVDVNIPSWVQAGGGNSSVQVDVKNTSGS